MEPDRGDAGEPNEGSVSAVWGEGDSQGEAGKPYRHPVKSGLYAARARGLMFALFIADGASCSDGELSSSGGSVCRRSEFRISMRISSVSVKCPAHPPRFRAWSSFSRDRDVALTWLPFV